MWLLAVACPAGQWVNAINPQACSTPVAGGTGTYPSGVPPQLTGYSAANVPEAETISNDCTFARTGTNAYQLTCTTAGGGTGNFRAGSLGVGVAADGNPGDIAAPGGIGLGTLSSGLGPFTGGTILLDNYVEGVNNNIYFLLGVDNGSAQVNVLKIDASNIIHFGDNTHGFLLDAGLATTITLSVNGSTIATISSTGTAVTGKITATTVVKNGVGALATFGTCNAALEGGMATQTNSTAACSAGATATSAGTTHCQLYCNGSAWKQTGL